MEFTLTFLTFDKFKYNHSQQGKLLAFIGIFSSIVQGLFKYLFLGFYVRRFAHKNVSEKTFVLQGLFTCALGLFIVSVVAYGYHSIFVLYLGLACIAFTSGTVVSNLTALASFESVKNESTQGSSLGLFRSW